MTPKTAKQALKKATFFSNKDNKMKPKSGKITLITGPASCGKSEWAEKLAASTGKDVIYIATAQIDTKDRDWCDRIQKHKNRRPKSWQNQEETINISALITNASSSHCLLVDSLGTWVANSLYPPSACGEGEGKFSEASWLELQATLLRALEVTKGDVILVAEETGWGVIPAYESGRKFRDRLGTLVRMIGTMADQVYLVTGGHVLNLTLLGQPIHSYLGLA
jgi:adenosylcobinamide kinase/adenosylcobinamide-phosphate guanylyltransferase